MPDTDKFVSFTPQPTQSISSRLLTLTLMVTTAAALLTTAIRLAIDYHNELQYLTKQQETIFSSYSPVLRETLWLANDHETDIVLRGILNFPNVVHAAIIIGDGSPSISVGTPEQENTLDFHHPIQRSYKGKNIDLGTLRISFTLSHIHRALLSDAISILLSQVVMILCIAIVIAAGFNHLFTRHLITISHYFSTLNLKNPDQPLILNRPPHHNDELQQVASAINEIRMRYLQNKEKHLNLLTSLNLQQEDLLSKNKELEEARRRLLESEHRHRTVLNLSIDGFIIVDDHGKITEVNEAYCSLLGFTKEEMLSKSLIELEGKETPLEITAHIQKVITTGHDRFETVHRHRDGHLVHLELSVNFAPSMGNLFFAFVRDISERKKAEEILRASEERYRSITEASAEAICQLDSRGHILFVNRAGQELFAISSEQIPTIHFADLLSDKYRSLFNEYIEMARSGQKVLAELYVHRKEGVAFPISLSLSPLHKNDETVGFTCISRDITDKRREEEERLRKSLAEKECLLKEIHHRVKNNMQIISSLLALQAQNINNPEIRNVVDDSRNRVRTMSLIHEMLYSDEDISMINFEHYINKLIQYLLETHGSTHKVTFRTRAPDITLPIDLAIPCGLITTELITNSLKYAFPGMRQGRIEVQMFKEEDGLITFSINDNGIGFPESYDPRDSSTLGMSLIRSLAKQLGGEPEFYNENGAGFRLSFPMKINNHNLRNETA